MGWKELTAYGISETEWNVADKIATFLESAVAITKHQAPMRSEVHYSKCKLNPFFKIEKTCKRIIVQGDPTLSPVATKMLQKLEEYNSRNLTGLM